MDYIIMKTLTKTFKGIKRFQLNHRIKLDGIRIFKKNYVFVQKLKNVKCKSEPLSK